MTRRGADDDGLMAGAFRGREEVDEGFVERRFVAAARLQLRGRAAGDHPAVVHGGEPIEPLRFFHVGRGDDDAHGWAPRADAVDQLPELPARQRVDACRRLVEDQQVRIVDEGAAQRQLLLHSARQLAGGPVGKRVETGRGEQIRDALLALDASAGRRGGRRSRDSRTRSASGRGCARGPAACRRCAAGSSGDVRRSVMSPPSAKTSPSWILRTPAMSASSVDLPTPSGPMSPTMQSGGIASVTSSSATVRR